MHIIPPRSFSPTLAAELRQYYALTQAELARWLGLSVRQVQAVEAGRREFSPAANDRLTELRFRMRPLGPPLPMPEALPPLPPPTAYTVVRAERTRALRRRRVRRCRHLARLLAFQLETLDLQDTALLRRRQALVALGLAAATPPLGAPPTYDLGPDAAWLAHLAANTAALPPRPDALARAHLRLRHRQLLEEARELEQLLAEEAEA
ncbi:hypothetical protein [Hymenobacter algoricola]|uniref:XRE family transcriptional regulator n=1 Tax=Hymenobacter algoricola TaxID=486267 RepID=A0ABP7NED6_9BACT